MNAAGVPVLGWGSLVSVLIGFLILAFIIFQMVKAANRVLRKPPEVEAGPSQVELLAEIRDELRYRTWYSLGPGLLANKRPQEVESGLTAKGSKQTLTPPLQQPSLRMRRARTIVRAGHD